MPGPSVTITTTETPQSAGSSLSTGTAFVVGFAIYGPEIPTLVRSLGEVKALYGPREGENLELYDALNTFFALGGARAYVNRVQGAGAPLAALLEVEAGATAKTLKFTAKYKGTYGNSLKVQIVENAGKTESHYIISNPEEVLETSPEFLTATAMFEYGKTHEAYVKIEEGTGYAAGKGSVVKVLAATKLATGANPTNNEANTIKAIEGFGRELGPGTLIAPCKEGLVEKVHTAMGEHCVIAMKNLRVAVCDLKEAAKAATTVATLTGEKGSYTTALSGAMIFTASAATVQGVTLGTTRTVPGSAVVAGLRAQVSKTGNDNQAPAGEVWPLSPFVLGFVNAFKQTEVEELSTAGINAFKEVNGVPCLYGFVTALSKEKDKIFWQASASCERMALVAGVEAIANTYLFKTIDGRKRLISRFQGDLQALGKRHWESNALFGGEAPEACLVNVGEPVNTLTTIQEGNLNAELVVRISPYANIVSVVIVSTPVSEVV